MTKVSRRDFLQITTRGLLAFSGLLGLGFIIRYLSFEPDPPPPAKFEIGPEANYPMESRTILPSIPAILIHTRSGFSAISLVCPHLGCTVEVKSSQFTCPCHGSRFNPSGEVTRGPAGNPLQSLRVERTSDGNLIVYKE